MKSYRVYDRNRSYKLIFANSVKIENGDLIFLKHVEVPDERYPHATPTIVYIPLHGIARGCWADFTEVADEV